MEPKQSTVPSRPLALPDSPTDGRPRFLAPLDCGGAVVVLLLDALTAYASTPSPSDLGDLAGVGVDLADCAPHVAHGVDYRSASGHFRLATDGWAVDLDGFRPRLTVSRGRYGGGDATDAGRRRVGESIARALREVVEKAPAALERAWVADLRGDRRRALDDAEQAVEALNVALGRADTVDRALGQEGPRASVTLDPDGRPFVEPDAGRVAARALLGHCEALLGLRLAEGRAPGEVLAVDRAHWDAWGAVVDSAPLLGVEVDPGVEAALDGVAEVVRAGRAFVVAADDLLGGLNPDGSGEPHGDDLERFEAEVGRLRREASHLGRTVGDSGGARGRRSRNLLASASTVLDFVEGYGAHGVALHGSTDFRRLLDDLAQALDPFGEAVES